MVKVFTQCAAYAMQDRSQMADREIFAGDVEASADSQAIQDVQQLLKTAFSGGSVYAYTLLSLITCFRRFLGRKRQ